MTHPVPSPPLSTRFWPRPTPWPMGVFLVSMALFHLLFAPFFLGPKVGGDFSGTLAHLLEGFYWFHNNDLLTIPWFAPGLCGGQPAFADPQNGTFSIPQLLTLFMPPIQAIYSTILLFAGLGYWGLYLLLTRTLGLRMGLGIAGAILFMFNTFFISRMMIGHSIFHGVMLIPWMALFLLHPLGDRWRPCSELLLAIGGGVVAAYWVHAAMAQLALPCMITVLGLAGILLLRQPLSPHLWLRVPVAGTIGFALSFSKIVASLAFIGHFSRTEYALPAFDSLWHLLLALARSLFWHPGNPAEHYTPHLVNMQVLLDTHEWMFGLSLLPIALLLVLAALYLYRIDQPSSQNQPVAPTTPRQWFGFTLALLVVLLPIVLNWGHPQWQGVLKTVPIIKSSSNLIRWWIIDLVLLLVATLFVAQQERVLRRHHGWVAVGAALLMGLQLAQIDRAYFTNQAIYSTQATSDGWRLAQQPDFSPRIKGCVSFESNGLIAIPINSNDLFIDGYSAINCYNPIFGYRLERFPRAPLQPGPVEKVTHGVYNIKNPACYLYPKENNCQPGDHFTVEQHAAMEAFTHYKPYPFAVSSLQKGADQISRWAVALTPLLLLLGVGGLFWERRHRTP